MATGSTIADVIDMFLDAPLQYAPRDTSRTAELWLNTFREIPDAILRQAASDYITTGSDWPSPAKFLALAAKIKARNGKSAVANPFPGKTYFSTLPAAYKREHDRLMERGTIPTDDELYALEKLSGRMES